MGTFVLTDASVTINGVDLSDHVRSISFPYEAEEVDDTNMGDTTRIMQGGLINYGVDIEFSQDFASGKVDDSLFDIVGTVVPVILIPVNTTVSATNPKFTMNMLVGSYNPINGSIGDLAVAPVHLAPAGAVTRGTSP